MTSDEAGNALGDGNTIADIVIGANCRLVHLRAERAGPGDGRVYTITLRLRDSGGAVTRADFQVSEPHGQNGVPAVKGATSHGNRGRRRLVHFFSRTHISAKKHLPPNRPAPIIRAAATTKQ